MDCPVERRLVEQARELADMTDITGNTLACLGGARNAGLDPAATRGLVHAALTLGATELDVFTAGGHRQRHKTARLFLSHLASVEDDLDERLGLVRRHHRRAVDAADSAEADLADWRRELDRAGRQLQAARAMGMLDPCDGCHHRRANAIARAEEAIETAHLAIMRCRKRVAMCRAVIGACVFLNDVLRQARVFIRRVPAQHSGTYQAVYDLLRAGGRMPLRGRDWFEDAAETIRVERV
jgi:hypothetical protein